MRANNKTKRIALLLALLALALSAALLERRLTGPMSARLVLDPITPSPQGIPVGTSTPPVTPPPDVPAIVARDEVPAGKALPAPQSLRPSDHPTAPPSGPPAGPRTERRAGTTSLEPQLLPPLATLTDPAPASAHYRDQLIDPSQPVDSALPTAPPGGVSPRLPGSASVEYRLFDERSKVDPSQRHYTEQGVAVAAQQETHGFGNFELHGVRTDVSRSDGLSNFDGGAYLNVTQRDFALNDRWAMDNQFGHLRARVPQLLSQGYRIRLPEPLVKGMSSEIRDAETTVRVAGGTLGTYAGRTFPVFSTAFSSGSIAGVSASTRFDPNWEGSAQYWQVNNADTASGVRSFGSAAGSVRYVGGQQTSVQASILRNSEGALGLWFDGARRFGAWLNSAGVYRMDRDLTWIDRNNPVLSDIEGTYWRANTRSFRSSYSVGGDWYRTNIDNDPALATHNSTYGFGNIGYTIDPTLTLGGFFSLGQDTVDGSGAQARDSTVTVRGSGSKRFAAGTSTATLGLTDRSGDNPYTRIETNWDHQWNPIGRFSPVHAGIAYVEQSNSASDFTEVQVRGGFSWVRNHVTASVNAYLGNQTSDINGSGHTMSLTAGLRWNLARAWRLGADVTYNRNALQVTNGVESRVTDRQVLVSVRYDAAWGRPEPAVGLASGRLGRGAVRGILFYDKNGNGLREPDEPGVPNVTMYLDRGFSVETNANGEFNFEPVPSGQHEITVNVANIPLPWGLDENRKIWADVHPRETAVIEIPLTRIGPE